MLFAQAWEMECESEEPFLASDDEMDTDGVDAPKGRGAPGWTRKKGEELAARPHPDQSNIARDIITMQTIHPSAPNYDEEVKKWRLAYRVPFPAFQVGTPTTVRTRFFGIALLPSWLRCAALADGRPVEGVFDNPRYVWPIWDFLFEGCDRAYVDYRASPCHAPCRHAPYHLAHAATE